MSESAVANAAPSKPAESLIDDVEALPVGTRLAEFEIRSVLGRGGFGIVYLASDLSLQRRVAIKEYLPAALAARRADGRLTVRSVAFAEAFEIGLRSFVNESRLLARFDHPALVKVHRFWEANGTAYMVMPYYEGATLTQVRQSMSVAPSEAWLRRILTALLGALNVMHRDCVCHRDVAPDNIVLLPSGLPVLLDFGAARHVLEDQAQEITAVVKPAYAPIEQYAAGTEFRQGPWTDIYGAAATLYYCLSGKPPPTAAARIVDDHYEPLALSPYLLEPADGEPYDRNWLAAIDWGLQVKPQDRPQSIGQWQQALESHAGAREPAARDRSAPTSTHRPAAAAHALPGAAFPLTRADRPAFATSALIARIAAAPKALPWAATALLLAGLLGGGWRAVTTAAPFSPAMVDPAPRVFDRPARVGSGASPLVDAAPPTAAPPQALPALHTPEVADADGATDTTASMSPLAGPAVSQTATKRKPKATKEKQSPALAAPRHDKSRAGPQVVQARPEPASSRFGEPMPRDLCRSRGFLGGLMCMREVCTSPKWATHAQCLNWHQMERRHMAESRP